METAMKNLSTLFIAFLFLQFTSLAQQGWFWQNPLPQDNNLNSVDFVNELTRWAVDEVNEAMGDKTPYYNASSTTRVRSFSWLKQILPV